MRDEVCLKDVESLRLPKGWQSFVRNAVLNVLGIVRIAMLVGRESLIMNGDVQGARIHQLESEVAMLCEELRINGARMQRVFPHRRPQYTTVERMTILELRAMRGWNKTETARHFFVSDDTVRAWLRRAEDDSLVHTNSPVNRFPDFVRYAVQQIKLFCPTLGKVKIADMFWREQESISAKQPWGGSCRKNLSTPQSQRLAMQADCTESCRNIPGHTWHADLTAVPISGGFRTNGLPNAIWQRWPVCWWVLNVIDHFSRRSMGFAVFPCRPTSEEVTTALDRIMTAERIRPKHLIVDQGPEFKCLVKHFENVWCEAKNILPRFGAVNKHGSIAVVERFHRTFKEILLLITVPEHQPDFEHAVGLVIDWSNEHRPHETLVGKTPNEMCHSRPPANEQPRIEPRRNWPRGSPCAKPQVEIDGEPGDAILFELDGHQDRRHLPIIRVRPAA